MVTTLNLGDAAFKMGMLDHFGVRGDVGGEERKPRPATGPVDDTGGGGYCPTCAKKGEVVMGVVVMGEGDGFVRDSGSMIQH